MSLKRFADLPRAKLFEVNGDLYLKLTPNSTLDGMGVNAVRISDAAFVGFPDGEIVETVQRASEMELTSVADEAIYVGM